MSNTKRPTWGGGGRSKLGKSKEKKKKISSATSAAPDTRRERRPRAQFIRIRDIEHGGDIVSWGAFFCVDSDID